MDTFSSHPSCTLVQSLNTLSSNQYLYKPIPPGHIRLLTIHSSGRRPTNYSLDTYTQELAPEYDAVSYCWGEDLTSTIINCNGSDLRIRKSLYIALPYLADRPNPARPLWIDAICLNQEDNNEKAIHVPLMHEIYKNAERTVVWLGEPDEDTDIALDFMSEVIFHLDNGGKPEAIDSFGHEEEWKAIREYLQRPWFNRLWALQELLLSKAIEMLCSSKKTRVLTWQILEKFLDFTRNHHLARNLLNTPFEFLNSTYLNLRFIQSTRSVLMKHGNIRLAGLLDLMRMRSCHEPVDKIWALLGLLPHHFLEEIQRKNIIDYSDSGRRYYWRSYLALMKLLYAWDIYEFNITVNWTMEYPRHALLPSWCPDFNANSVNLPLSQYGNFRAGLANHEVVRFSGYTSQLDSASDALSIIGFCVDEVRCVTSSYPGSGVQISQVSHIQSDGERAVWLEECEQLTRKILGESEDTIEALGRVLLAVDNEKENEFSGNLAHCYQFLRDTGKRFFDSAYSCPHTRGKMHAEYVGRVNIICANRKIFGTRRGRVGLGPAALEAGDKICVFSGADVLYVLRSTGDENSKHGKKLQNVQGKQPSSTQETFSLIGQAYIRGLMYGEAFTADSRGPDCELVIV